MTVQPKYTKENIGSFKLSPILRFSGCIGLDRAVASGWAEPDDVILSAAGVRAIMDDPECSDSVEFYDDFHSLVSGRFGKGGFMNELFTDHFFPPHRRFLDPHSVFAVVVEGSYSARKPEQ